MHRYEVREIIRRIQGSDDLYARSVGQCLIDFDAWPWTIVETFRNEPWGGHSVRDLPLDD